MNARTFALFITTASLLQASEPPAADRSAILSMAGEFEVTFNFQETLSLKNGYEIKPEKYRETAHELVIVAADTGTSIRLQHLLVADGAVIKHWAQIWTYEDTRICEFKGNNTWKMRSLTPQEVAGTWSQQVTQVDDSPRYESWGTWSHEGEVHQWTSKDTWRPLPRREHTKRKDYDVVAGTNRHVITASGWAHEQDNTKTIVRQGLIQPLTRESGLNTYTRITGFDFGPAKAMWVKDQPFWDTVVSVWQDIQQTREDICIRDRFDVPKLRAAIDEIQREQTQSLSTKVKASLETFLETQKPQQNAEAAAK